MLRRAFGLLLLCLIAPLHAQVLTRAELEGWMAAEPATRLAQVEREIAEARARQARAEQGIKLFGAASLGDYREPVTDEVRRTYTRAAAQIGVRLPLLGSRDAEERARMTAEAGVRQQQLREQIVRWQALKGLRSAYADYARATEQVALARAVLASRGEAEGVLEQRKRGHLLLEADRLEFQSVFFAARRNLLLHQARAQDALERLRIATGRDLPEFEPRASGWRTACLSLQGLREARDRHPEVRLAFADLEEKRGLQNLAGSVAEAGVNLVQTVSRDIGDLGGSGTSVSIDVRAPWNWQEVRNARRAAALGELTRAELQLEARRREFDQAVQRSFGVRAEREENLRFALQRVRATLEAMRVAQLRTAHLPGDMLEKTLQAKSALYNAASNAIDAALTLEQAQVEMLGLAEECEAAEASDDDLPDITGLLAQPLLPPAGLNASSANAAGLELKLERQLVRAPGTLGWYAWSGLALVDRAEAQGDAFWSTLPRGSRLLLSFDAPAIRQLDTQPVGERLTRFLGSAKAHGVRVELLLGDPEWVLPQARPDLIALVRRLQVFAFQGVHLDIERSQLPAGAQRDWPVRLVQTMAQVRAATALPLAVSLHPRDTADERFVHALAQAGVNEVLLMAYVTDAARAEKIAARVLRAHPGLAVGLAQSIEEKLAPSESWARRGQTRAREAWQQLDSRLARFPNFSGIVVQSLESFQGAAP